MATIAELAEEIGPRRPTGRGGEPRPPTRWSLACAPPGSMPPPSVPRLLDLRRRRSGSSSASRRLRRCCRRRRGCCAGRSTLARRGGADQRGLASLRRRSRSAAVAAAEPQRRRDDRAVGEVARTLCLVAHMDTSRSGLIFDPAPRRLDAGWIAANSILVLAQAAARAASRRAAARSAGASPASSAARCSASLGLLAEREMRGVDVPGRQRQRLRLRGRRRARLATRRRAARIDPRRGPDHRLRGGGHARRPRLSRLTRHRWLAVPQLRQRRRPRQRPVPAPRGRDRQVGRRSGPDRRGRSGRDRRGRTCGWRPRIARPVSPTTAARSSPPAGGR